MQSLRKLFLVVLLLGAMFTPCPLGMSFVPPYLVETIFWSSQEVLPLAEERPNVQTQILESQNYFSQVSRGPPVLLFA